MSMLLLSDVSPVNPFPADCTSCTQSCRPANNRQCGGNVWPGMCLLTGTHFDSDADAVEVSRGSSYRMLVAMYTASAPTPPTLLSSRHRNLSRCTPLRNLHINAISPPCCSMEGPSSSDPGLHVTFGRHVLEARMSLAAVAVAQMCGRTGTKGGSELNRFRCDRSIQQGCGPQELQRVA